MPKRNGIHSVLNSSSYIKSPLQNARRFNSHPSPLYARLVEINPHLWYCIFKKQYREKSHQCDDGTFSSELSGTEQGPDKPVDLLLLWVMLVVVQWDL